MIKGYKGTLYGNYRQKSFSDVWNNVDDFIADYTDVGIPVSISNTYAETLYYLLYAKYGNSIIASSDLTRFKYDLFSRIWQYAPNWVKRVELQAKLRNLTDDQLLEGSRQIYNNAANPSSEPGTFTDEELVYINNQNVTKNKKGKLEGYALLASLLEDDVTEVLLKKFKNLFLTIVLPELPLWYTSEGEEDGNI